MEEGDERNMVVWKIKLGGRGGEWHGRKVKALHLGGKQMGEDYSRSWRSTGRKATILDGMVLWEGKK